MNKTKWRGLLIGAGILIVGLLVIYYPKPAPDTGSTGYHMLAVLPLSGNLAVVGAPKREAMQLALEQGKAAYPDVNLTIDFQDSQGNAKDAINVLNQALATRRPDLLFVDLTPVVDAALPIVDSNRIVTFAGSAQAGITKRSEYLFRVFPGGDQEVQLVLGFLRTRQPKGVYVLHTNELYGRSVMQELAKAKDEIHLVGSDEYALSDKDFRAHLAKARESGAEMIGLFGYGGEYATLLRQANELNIPPHRFLANLGGVNIGVLQLPQELTEGMTFVGPSFALRSANAESFPHQQKLMTSYKEKYGRPPDFRVAFVYDTVMLLYQNLHQSRKLEELAGHLQKTRDYQGTSGKISISETRDAVVELELGKYQSGKPVGMSEK